MYWYLLILGILFIVMVYTNKHNTEGFASKETFSHLSLVEMIAQLRNPVLSDAAPNAFGSNVMHDKESYYIDSCNYDPTSKLLDDINYCRNYVNNNMGNPFTNARFNASCGVCMTQGTVLLDQAPFSITTNTKGTGVVVYKEDKDFSIHEGAQAVPSSHSAFCEGLIINSNIIPSNAHINNIKGLVINSQQYTETLAYLNNMKSISFNDITTCAASMSKSIQCTFSNTVIESMRFVFGHFNDECEPGSNLASIDTTPRPVDCIGEQGCTFSSNLPAGYRQWYLTAECAVQEEPIPPSLYSMALFTPPLLRSADSWYIVYSSNGIPQYSVKMSGGGNTIGFRNLSGNLVTSLQVNERTVDVQTLTKIMVIALAYPGKLSKSQYPEISPVTDGLFLSQPFPSATLMTASASQNIPSSVYPYFWTPDYGENPKQQITVYGLCTLTVDTQVKIESSTSASFDLYLHKLKQYTNTNNGNTIRFNAPNNTFALYKGTNTIRLDITSPTPVTGIHFAMKDLSGNVVCSLNTSWVYSRYKLKDPFELPPASPTIPTTIVNEGAPPVTTNPNSQSSAGNVLTLSPRASLPSILWMSLASSSDGNIMYAVANSYMVKSTNRGVSWVELKGTDTAGITDTRYYNICMSSDCSYGLLSTLGGPLFVWRGGTWNLAANIPTYGAVTCTPNASVMYVACEGSGVYKSTNYGVTWTLLMQGVDEISGVNRAWRTITCSSNGVYVLLACYNWGVYVSSDSGATWRKTNLNNSLPWQSSTCSADGSTMSVVHWGGELYISRNSGLSWTKAVSPPSGVRLSGAITVSSSSDAMKFIVTVTDGLLVSTDGGNNWIYQASTSTCGTILLSSGGSVGLLAPSLAGTLQLVTFAGGGTPPQTQLLMQQSSSSTSL